MIDISNITYTDCWDNDKMKSTEMYFSLSEDATKNLLGGRFKKEYESAVKNYLCKNETEISPYAELQLSCPSGKSFIGNGTIELGIGIEIENETTILDIISLTQDVVSEKVASELWEETLNNQKVQLINVNKKMKKY